MSLLDKKKIKRKMAVANDCVYENLYSVCLCDVCVLLVLMYWCTLFYSLISPLTHIHIDRLSAIYHSISQTHFLSKNKLDIPFDFVIKFSKHYFTIIGQKYINTLCTVFIRYFKMVNINMQEKRNPLTASFKRSSTTSTLVR